jgi:hypothetical protein
LAGLGHNSNRTSTAAGTVPQDVGMAKIDYSRLG